ncbi:MAG: tetratricopeptide repeat protein [Holophagaceae bacterium]
MAIDRVRVKKEADRLLTAGRIERAIEEFQKLVEDSPRDFNTLNQVGDLCVQVGRVKEGVEIHKRLASAYERDGFHARAAAIFQKVVRNAPEDLDAAQRLADLYRQMNRPADAVRVHLQVAEHFQKKGLIKRALEEFNKVVDLDPKNLKMKVRLADLYNKEGLKDRAAGIYLEVAESLAMEQMPLEAGQILDRAKAMISTPQVFLTQSRLGVIQGDYGAAALHLREGLEANPRDPELLEALAEIELRSGHPERALEALAQVAQLPEKSLPLCEKALRNLAQADRAEEGLRLFAPIARELARRGGGDTVANCLRSALKDALGTEAFILLAELAHQSGNRMEQVNALQNAFGLAAQEGDAALTDRLATQLQGMGVVPNAGIAAPRPVGGVPSFDRVGAPDIIRHGVGTEVDPLRRMRIEQISREAEALMRGGSPERAVETYRRALELDPEDLTIIEAIASVHRFTGRLTQVQMQYVQSAQALAQAGKKLEASHLLDQADVLFPGSTRIHRRTLGLPEAGVPPPAFGAMVPKGEGDPFHQSAPSPDLAPLDPIALGVGLPLLPDPGVEVDADIPDLFALPPESLDWLEPVPQEPPSDGVLPPSLLTAPLPPMPTQLLAPETIDAINALPEQERVFELAPEPEPLPALELAPEPEMLPALEPEPVPALELEPAPTLDPPVAELAPEAPPPTLVTPPEVESLLGDIDFQLDYGSPEEAKLEIEAALKQFPGQPELAARLERAQAALDKLGHQVREEALQEADFANSFFDLTDVLGTALLDAGEGEEMHDATHVVEKIQTVDELFSAFREGVEKQVQGDDYDTHYNLGIAYKEMMLIDPAIEEFRVAMGDPERTLECCSMLSICEQARGDLDAAVAWLRQGIEAPGFPPEDSVGLRYDLAEIYLQQGQADLATEAFQSVHALDPDYRDVAARLA